MKVGDKVKFLGTRMFWFEDIIKNGYNLSTKKIYTVSYLFEHSSWTCIKLKETGDLPYNHMWFKVV